MAVIEIKDFSFRYESEETQYALQDINLTINKGEFVSIIGSNGSGKTSLCNAIRGFIPKFYKGDLSGSVHINGVDIEERSIGELARDIGFVFQNPFTQMSGATKTVYDELAYGLGNLGIEPANIIARVDEMVRLAKLEELVDRNPFQLSGGQQQRVALSSILAMDQDILVIDEPTSQLDPQSTDDVFALIEQSKQAGKTIVLVEHKMEHIAKFSDRVVLIDSGKIVVDGSPEAIFANPKVAELGTRLPQPYVVADFLRNQGIALQPSVLQSSDLIDAVLQWAEQEGKTSLVTAITSNQS